MIRESRVVITLVLANGGNVKYAGLNDLISLINLISSR
jgi:hypothetical protein